MQHEPEVTITLPARLLSVSSVGSEAMQHRHPDRHTCGDADFQYPRSDRRRCNFVCNQDQTACSTFQYPRSDRRRCNNDGASLEELACINFQYPRSDRRRCNNHIPRWAAPGPQLSVSSVGSEAMQRSPFIEALYHCLELSVSSVGSEAMQPSLLPFFPFRPPSFQYPRSDRRRCNPQKQIASRPSPELSVSSVGSEAMQLLFLFPLLIFLLAFSILGRIGGDATESHRIRIVM